MELRCFRAAAVCDHNFKILATRDMRNALRTNSELRAKWSIRLCISCGELEAKNMETDRIWDLRTIYHISPVNSQLIQRTIMLIDSIKGDAQ